VHNIFQGFEKMSKNSFQHPRVLLKLSGEALMGEEDYGIDPGMLGRLAAEIHELATAGLQLGLVIGGGNIFRGAGLAAGGMNRVTGDQMGMLATVINALAMADKLEKLGTPARVLSALTMDQVCESYTQRGALEHLDSGRVVLLAAGTGNPFFTTDSAASLRAVEIGAGLLLKATKVDGVYTDDPVKNPDATKYERLSYDEAINQKLGVMDATALVLCRDNGLPLRVFDLFTPGNLEGAVRGEPVGTLVE
jgi:uridylate kinase